MMYSMMILKLAIGFLCLIIQINLLGKGNLAPNSAMDQVQNYVLGGIIGGMIYNASIGPLDFLLVLIGWTILVLTLRFITANSRTAKEWIDGKPVILIDQGAIRVRDCMRYGILAHDLDLKLRMAGVSEIRTVKRAVLEQNGQLSVVQYGENNPRYPLIMDGQINTDVLSAINKSEAWLVETLRTMGYAPIDIYLAEWSGGILIPHPYKSKQEKHSFLHFRSRGK